MSTSTEHRYYTEIQALLHTVHEELEMLQGDQNQYNLPSEITLRLQKIAETLQKIEDIIKQREHSTTNDRETMKILQDELSKLKKKAKELETGQVAFVFEQAVAKYVYPEHKQIGVVDVYNRMVNWLNQKPKDEDKAQERLEAKAKLEYLKEKWGLSAEHDELRRKVKKSRISAAHPPVDLETLEIPSTFNETEKKCFDDFLKIIKLVKSDRSPIE